MDGKIFIITGGNTGLGYQTARALVKRGATVIIACRDLLKAEEAVKKIQAETSEGKLIALELDLESFASIRTFCEVIKNDYADFACLINNAGMAMRGTKSSKEGFEIHAATNHLGHFLLTNLLLDLIKKNNSRVVVVSSKLHEKGVINFDNFGQTESSYYKSKKQNQLYADSKLMTFYFAKELYRRGIDAHVCCPGLSYTDFFRNFGLRFYHFIIFSPVVLLFLRSAQQAAQNIVHCATDNENTKDKNPSSSFIVINLKQSKSKVDLKDDVSERLWIESSKLCGINQ